MRLAKWQGLGNDYLVLEESEVGVGLTSDQIKLLCDRHFGLGSDGVLLNCQPSGAVEGAVTRMRIFNPDGSESEMCGNGMRIFARYLAALGVVGDEEFTVETLAGPIRPRVVEGNQVRVDMGLARFHSANISPEAGTGDIVSSVLEAGGSQYTFTFVDVGNPHCVIEVAEPSDAYVAEVGSVIEHHPLFPNRTNVEFIAVRADGSVNMRVWERGVGETQACGTGATAVGAACVRLGRTNSPVVVHLLGGDLVIEAVDGKDAGDADGRALRVYMTGPAEEVFVADVAHDLARRLEMS